MCGFDNDSIVDWATRPLAPNAEVYSDGLACFASVIDLAHVHTVFDTGGGRAATETRGARWVNSLLANVKRVIGGGYLAQTTQVRKALSRRSRLPFQPGFLLPSRVI